MFKLSSVTHDLAMAAEQGRLEPAYEMEKEVFKILHERDMVNERPVGVQSDQEVHVAVLTRLAPDHGPKDAHVACSMPGSNPEDVVSPTQNLVQGNHRCIPALSYP